MANPTIGGKTVKLLTHNLDPMGEQSEDITRRGVSGCAVTKIGKRSEHSRAVTKVDIVDDQAEFTAYKALETTLITIVDNHGKTYNNVLVHKVRKTSARKINTIVGGVSGQDSAYLLVCEWTLQCTEV